MVPERLRRRRSVPASVRRPAPHAAFVTFATIVLVGFLLWASQEVLVPVAIAVLITFVLTPLADRLRRAIGHVPAVLASVMLALGIVVALGWAVESQFFDVVDQLPNYQSRIHDKVERLRHSGGSLGDVTQKFEQIDRAIQPPAVPATGPTSGPATQGAKTAAREPAIDPTRPGAPTLPNVTPQTPLPVRIYDEPDTIGSRLSAYLSSAIEGVTTAFIVLIFVIFMLLGRDDLRDRMIRLAGGGEEQLDTTTKALDDAGRRVSRYLVAQLAVNTIYGISIAIGLWAIGWFFASADNEGFPSIWLLGLLCGMFRFVPYLGPVLGSVLPLAIAFGFFENNAVFFATGGLFVAIEIVVSQFVEPLLYGDKTGMSPIAVLVAAAFWTWLWGPVGLLLSTPLTVVLVVMGRYVPSLHFLQVLLGDEPALAPHERLYQRLTMLDRDGADRVAEEVADERGLAAAYDEALLPALASAERNLRRGTLHRSQYAFLRGHVEEMARELALADAEKQAAEAKPDANAASTDATVGPAPRPPTRILCLATGGRADEIAGRMLAALLERRGVNGVEVRTVRARGRDALDGALARVADANEGPGDGPGVVVLSAMPPASVSRARSACRRTRGVVPKERQVVALWTAPRDVTDATRRRIDCAAESAVVYTLATAADAVEAAIRRGDATEKPQAIG